MRSLYYLTAIVVLLSSCKSQEDIQREQMVDSLSIQMVENQKLSTDSTSKIQELEEQIAFIRGKFEETGHELGLEQEEKNVEIEARVKIAEEQLLILKNKQLEDRATIDALTKRLAENKKFITEVLSKLKGISKVSGGKSSGKKLGPYDQAMSDYKKKRYKSARSQLEVLVEKSIYKGNRKARIIHNLGMISYIQKRYDDSLVYFSRLFTEHGKSNYVKNGLLHLGYSFLKLKQKAQAKQTFEELVNKYPKAWQSNNARKELKKL